MSDNVSDKFQENAEPVEQANPVPKVVMGLMLGLVVWSVSYIFIQEVGADVSLGDRRDVSTLAAAPAGAVNGAQIFAANCAACHQATGKGLPGVFPPLAGSSWVTDDPATLTQIVLHGMNGEIEVQGTVYRGAMPAFAQLSDAEMAAVLSYIRSAWGNSGAPVEADAVAAERTRTAGRTEPWSNPGQLAEALAAVQK